MTHNINITKLNFFFDLCNQIINVACNSYCNLLFLTFLFFLLSQSVIVYFIVQLIVHCFYIHTICYGVNALEFA